MSTQTTRWTTSSISLSPETLTRVKKALPRWGDRSRLIARLIEMWLNGEIVATNVLLRGSVVHPTKEKISGSLIQPQIK